LSHHPEKDVAAGMGKILLTRCVSYGVQLLPWLQKQTGTQYAKEAKLLKKDNKKADVDPALGNMYNTDIDYPVSLHSTVQANVF